MGFKFFANNGGDKTYHCAICQVYLADKAAIKSTNFNGVTGQAYLFKTVSNVSYGALTRREMMTGNHFVRDVFCGGCKEHIGWMYELAPTDHEKYKEGCTILERLHIIESGMISDDDPPPREEELEAPEDDDDDVLLRAETPPPLQAPPPIRAAPAHPPPLIPMALLAQQVMARREAPPPENVLPVAAAPPVIPNMQRVRRARIRMPPVADPRYRPRPRADLEADPPYFHRDRRNRIPVARIGVRERLLRNLGRYALAVFERTLGQFNQAVAICCRDGDNRPLLDMGFRREMARYHLPIDIMWQHGEYHPSGLADQVLILFFEDMDNVRLRTEWEQQQAENPEAMPDLDELNALLQERRNLQFPEIAEAARRERMVARRAARRAIEAPGAAEAPRAPEGAPRPPGRRPPGRQNLEMQRRFAENPELFLPNPEELARQEAVRIRVRQRLAEMEANGEIARIMARARGDDVEEEQEQPAALGARNAHLAE